ncbi:C40 family peptidase [Xanthobacter agilis]|uniref:Cell wall-associated NlpC family hydrolase n=1 Tax=Xanthobacter agilis TaxID=47492 RepID=A0ABU0L8Z1_XANAG|nr:NlpC/P60 family protein [Xanthobacter agilis]MDQ0503583.1 cell wall-associated NlpC family hydrolase [Xanthobacter agilis]
MALPEGFDPRLTPARDDLAAAHLKGVVEAPRYVDGEAREVAEPVAPLRRRPAGDAPLDTEALHGERVTVYADDGEGWAFAQLARDGYVGYLPTEALRPIGPAPTHKVAVPRTFIFPGPDIKLPPRGALCFGSAVAVRAEKGAFAAIPEGFIFARHLAPLDARETDFVAVASRFLGVPYLWGGRSALGLDCSGLVQTALFACGIAAPRDSDMQERTLGTALPLDTPLRRGDLLFWPGHVAIVAAPDTLLHANAFHMMVAREPLAPALERIAASAPLRSLRRLDPTPEPQGNAHE